MWIYKISNNQNDRVYIGQTSISTVRRWQCHCSSAKKLNIKSKIAVAIRELGFDAFSIEIIDTAYSLEHLNELEVYWIAHYKSNESGYNVTYGGGRRQISEKHKKAISAALKGKPTGRLGEKMSDAIKEKIRIGNTGKKMSAESIEKYKANRKFKKGEEHPWFGKTMPSEIIERNASKKRKMSLDKSNKMLQRYLNGETVSELFKECPELRGVQALYAILYAAKKRNKIFIKKRKQRCDKGVPRPQSNRVGFLLRNNK